MGVSEQFWSVEQLLLLRWSSNRWVVACRGNNYPNNYPGKIYTFYLVFKDTGLVVQAVPECLALVG